MWDPNKQTAIDWLEAHADPVCFHAARPVIDDRGVTLFAEVETAGDAGYPTVLWAAGPRQRIRPIARQLFTTRHDERLLWLIGWLEGRWPRGKLRLGLPLSEEGRGRSLLHVRAPMPPPRMLLSQGPLPLPRSSVEHFRAFHRATGTQHLTSGGLELMDDRVVALTVTWRIPPGSLIPCLSAWPVEAPVTLTEPESAVDIEARYMPDPCPSLRVILPPNEGHRVVWTLDQEGGAQRHLWVALRRAVHKRD